MEAGLPRQHAHHRQSLSDVHTPIPQNGPVPIPQGGHAPPGLNGVNGGGPIPQGGHASLGHNGMNGGGFGYVQRGGHMNNNGTQLGRSPPQAQAKNTAHVPCKFFKVGNCQAGNACPFSHAPDALNEPAPCKYFAKGNCKFGSKCANPHLLPDGRDGRKMHMRGQYGYGYQARGQYGNAGPQAAYNNMPHMPAQQAVYQSPMQPQDEYFPGQPQQRIPENGSNMDSLYPSQAYGSSPHDPYLSLSPAARAMDATLPASFDDRALTLHHHEGPIAASAPKRFGFGPLTANSPTTSTATSNAFGNLSYLASSNTRSSNRNSLLGTSPSAVEDAFPRRILHSDLRPPPSMYSSSFQGPFLVTTSPPPPEDSSDERSSEELTRVPGALDDLLTPKEKLRRFSRPAADADRPRSFSGLGSPLGSSPVGSPSNASPSSRYGALFARRQRTDETNNDLGTSAPGASAFGHVGSPLRKSSLQSDVLSASASKPSQVARSRSGNESMFATSSSPVARPSGLGMLSQQLRASRLSNGQNADESELTGTASQLRSIPVSGAASSQRLDRTFSTSSMGRSVGDRIDEEETETDDDMFQMDDETRDKDAHKKAVNHTPVPDVAAGSAEQIEDKPSRERTPTSIQDVNATAEVSKSQSQPIPQPTSRWGGQSAWNVVARLTSSQKPSAESQQQKNKAR